MPNIQILETNERKVCNKIAEISPIKEICQAKEEYWHNYLVLTNLHMKHIKNDRGNPIELTIREIIALTAVPLSLSEDKLIEEIEKLDYESKPYKIRRVFQKLSDLDIIISGLGKLQMHPKVLFLILARIAENKSLDG